VNSRKSGLKPEPENPASPLETTDGLGRWTSLVLRRELVWTCSPPEEQDRKKLLVSLKHIHIHSHVVEVDRSSAPHRGRRPGFQEQLAFPHALHLSVRKPISHRAYQASRLLTLLVADLRTDSRARLSTLLIKLRMLFLRLSATAISPSTTFCSSLVLPSRTFRAMLHLH
jgi:hypothetical protein